MSTKRTVVKLVAVESVRGPEASDGLLELMLPSLEPAKIRLLLGERAQILADERADRSAALGGADPRRPIDVVGHGDSDVLHQPSLHIYTDPV